MNIAFAVAFRYAHGKGPQSKCWSAIGGNAVRWPWRLLMKVLISLFGVLCVTGVLGCSDDAAPSDPKLANCGTFCDKVVECSEGASRPVCTSDCNVIANSLSLVSPQCLAGFAAINACVSGLSCEEREAWLDGIPPDSYPCKAEDDAGEAACGGGT